jgi:hypothetical protein
VRSGSGTSLELGKEVIHTTLLTKDLLRQIPPLYSQEEDADPRIVCKFFLPDGGWTWYVIEGSTRERAGCGWGHNCHHKPLRDYDPERDDVLFFGYVEGLYPELGFFTLSELEAVRGRLGLPIERDQFFTPCTLSAIRDRQEGRA